MEKELTAGLIIKDGRLLMLHNIKHGTARIEPPGGKRHEGESLEDSVRRELAEELGLAAGSLAYFGAYATHSPEGPFTVHMYLCGNVTGTPCLLEPDKFCAFGWYTVDELRRFREEGSLVPNMAEALDGLARLLSVK